MATIIQRSFTGGELSPSLRSRVDLSKYLSGAALLRNFIVSRHGGILNRAGTKFVSTIRPILGNAAKLVPFELSDEDTRILELGNFYMRIIENGEYKKNNEIEITSIDAGTGLITTSAPHQLSDTPGVAPVPPAVLLKGLTGDWAFLNNRIVHVDSIPSTTTFYVYEDDALNVGVYDPTGKDAFSGSATMQEIWQLGTQWPAFAALEADYVQSLNTITVAHKLFKPQDIIRQTNGAWTIQDVNLAPTNGPYDVTGVSGGGSDASKAPNVSKYVLTVFNLDTGLESLPGTPLGISNASLHPLPTSPIIVDNPFATIGKRSVINYYKTDGYGKDFGFIGSRDSNLSFRDIGIEPDYSVTPPAETEFFKLDALDAEITNFPDVVSIVKQRKIFANFDSDSEAIAASRIGDYENFTVHNPILDDDAIFTKISGLRLNEVRHILELRVPVVFTASGEWVLGNEGDALTPSNINPRQHSYNGSSKVKPVVIGSTALYVQARETIIRDLGFDFNVDGYSGNDLTVFSSHLFDDYTIKSMDYQQIPHSILWVVRSDGVLLSLTYIKEQQIFAWCQHDLSGGLVEQVVTVPEGSEDSVYLVVKRKVNGFDLRYIERLEKRNIVQDNTVPFMDAHLSYNGWNTDEDIGLTIEQDVAGPEDWTYGQELRLTRNGALTFSEADIGNEYHFPYTEEGEPRVLKFKVERYESGDAGTQVYGTVNKTVPLSLRSEITSNWGRAVDRVEGLVHLEGKSVSILGDGFVVGSPFNNDYEEYLIENGGLDLDKPYVEIYVGLPYTSDYESLSIDSTKSETLIDKKAIINSVTLDVLETRGLWVGNKEPQGSDKTQHLNEIKPRSTEHYDEKTKLKTEAVDVTIQANWEGKGKVFVRQIDPLPATILAVAPNGKFPFNKGGE